MAEAYDTATRKAQDYYDSDDADTFYREIWGGEDIHVGLYQPGDTIGEAGRRTVLDMAGRLAALRRPGARVLDLGAGYGGAARVLAREFDASVTCLNLSEVENARNRELTLGQGLSAKVRVVHGAFEDIPEPDANFDVVWSQDAILHSGDRQRVLDEAARVLRSGGEMILTDPMQADDLEDATSLKPIYERIHLESLATFGFYRKALKARGLEEVSVTDLTGQLTHHYGRVREALIERREALKGHVSEDYVARMLDGLQHWVDAGRAHKLAWGIMHFRKPA